METLGATKILFLSLLSFLLPFLGFVFLYNSKFAGTTYINYFTHSILILPIFFICFYIARTAYLSYRESREPRLLFVALAFFTFGLSFFIHAITIPILPFLNESIFDISEHIGLFLGAIVLLAGLTVSFLAQKDQLYKHKLKIFAILSFGFLLWFVSLAVFPRFAGAIESIINIFVALTTLCFLVSLLFLLRAYAEKPSILFFYFISGFAILINTAIIPLFYEEWNLPWWFFHFVLLAGFVAILLGLTKSGERRKTGGFEAFQGIPVHSKISTRIASFAIAMTLIPLSFVLFGGFGVFENSLKKQAIDSMALAAEAREGQLLTFLDSMKKRAADFSSDGFIRDSIKDITADPFDQKVVRALNSHLKNNKLVLDSALYGINVLDLTGTIVASTNEEELGKDESRDEYFTNAAKLDYAEASMSDVRVSDHFNIPILSMNTYAVLTDRVSGKKLGVIVLYFGTKHLSDILSGKHQVELGALSGGLGGKTMNVYLVNKDKLVITESRFLGKDALLKQTVDNEPINACIAAREERTGLWQDYRDISVYGASMCMPGNGWTLLAETEEAEVLIPVTALKKTFAINILLLLSFILFLGFYFSRRLTKPLEILTRTSKKIIEGDMSVRAEVLSEDELGVLARSFNQMADNLIQSNKRSQEDNLRLAIKVMEEEELTKDLEETKGAILNILDDLKKEKEGVEREAQNTKKFQQAAEASTDSILIADANSVILYANPAWLKLNGYALEEVLGKNPRILQSGKTPPRVYENMWKALSAKQSFVSEEIINKRKDGSEYAEHDSITPIVVNDEVKFYLGISQDISKRKEVDRLKSEFITVASHQLRTPLTSIRWVVELFLKKEQLTDQGKEYLHDIHTSAQKLSELVDILLNVSRIEEGEVAVSPRPLEIVKFLSNYVEELRPLLDKKKLTLNFTHPDELTISTDESAFRNVAQSIVSNSVEYTLAGGTINVDLKKNEHEFYLTISDTGIGIPKAEQDHISHKFTRGSNAMLIKTDGTGLGLYIAYRAVESLGGSIRFESEENKGTTFFIKLPIESKVRAGKKLI